jgi:hypothetical protein
VDKSIFVETAQAMGTGNLIENLLDLDFGGESVSNASKPPATLENTGTVVDLLSMDDPAISPTPLGVGIPIETFLSGDKAQGLELIGNFSKPYFTFNVDTTPY